MFSSSGQSLNDEMRLVLPLDCSLVTLHTAHLIEYSTRNKLLTFDYFRVFGFKMSKILLQLSNLQIVFLQILIFILTETEAPI